jgi:hypothetical protein
VEVVEEEADVAGAAVADAEEAAEADAESEEP